MLYLLAPEKGASYARIEDCFRRYYDIDLRDDEWKASIDRYRDNRFAF